MKRGVVLSYSWRDDVYRTLDEMLDGIALSAITERTSDYLDARQLVLSDSPELIDGLLSSERLAGHASSNGYGRADLEEAFERLRDLFEKSLEDLFLMHAESAVYSMARDRMIQMTAERIKDSIKDDLDPEVMAAGLLERAEEGRGFDGNSFSGELPAIYMKLGNPESVSMDLHLDSFASRPPGP